MSLAGDGLVWNARRERCGLIHYRISISIDRCDGGRQRESGHTRLIQSAYCSDPNARVSKDDLAADGTHPRGEVGRNAFALEANEIIASSGV